MIAAPVSDPVNGWDSIVIPVGCPCCGGRLSTVNPGASNGREAKTIVACMATRREYIVVARIDPLNTSVHHHH